MAEKDQLLEMLNHVRDDFSGDVTTDPIKETQTETFKVKAHRDFKVSDLIEAQSEPNHDLNHRHDYLKQFGIKIDFTKKKLPRFRVPMQYLAPWLFYDCHKTQDFSVIPEHLTLAFNDLCDKDKAIKTYLLAFYDFFVSKRHFRNIHVMAKNLMDPAKQGHLKSRETLVRNWLFKPDLIPELDHDTVSLWIDSILDSDAPDFTTSHRFFADAYWALHEGHFNTKRLREIKRISRSDLQEDALSWRIGTASIYMYGIPKAKLIHFRDTLAEQLGSLFSETLKSTADDTPLKPVRFALRDNLFIYSIPKPEEERVDLTVGSSGVHIASVKLKPQKRKKLQAFFDKLNSIINYEPIMIREVSQDTLAFANNKDKNNDA